MRAPLRLRATFAILARLAPQAGGSLAADLFTTPRKHKRPAWEQAHIDRARRIVLPGDVAAWQWGKGGRTPVLLLHGWEGRGAQLGFFIEPIVALGHRVIAMDAPGHGETPGRRSGPFDFARALVDAGRSLGPMHAVISHSMGAVAALFALERGLDVGRAVFLGAPSSIDEPVNRFADYAGLSPRLRRHFRNVLAERTGVRNSDIDLPAIARRHKLPVLIVHDLHDMEVPVRNGRVMARAYPRASLVEVEAGGHRRMLKSPEVVARVAEFVGRT